MITKFKIFENNETNLYDEDDFVLLVPDKYEDETTMLDRVGVVINLSYHEGDGWQYTLWMIGPSLFELGLLEDAIERKLTPEEIQQVKIELEAKKYNL